MKDDLDLYERMEMPNLRGIKVGEVVFGNLPNEVRPFIYLGEGNLYGKNVQKLVSAPLHRVDTTEDVDVIGIRRGANHLYQQVSPGTTEHSSLVQKLKSLRIPHD
jgi:hypothetical protein